MKFTEFECFLFRFVLYIKYDDFYASYMIAKNCYNLNAEGKMISEFVGKYCKILACLGSAGKVGGSVPIDIYGKIVKVDSDFVAVNVDSVKCASYMPIPKEFVGLSLVNKQYVIAVTLLKGPIASNDVVAKKK